jgi:hypothetical protein
MSHVFLYRTDESPFGYSWKEWASLWAKWMLSIPKKTNPTLDDTGMYSSVNQYCKNVWFLTGTFGNIVPIVRKCHILKEKSILFPILEKEDSLAEDSDLKSDSDLIKRSKEAINNVVSMEVTLDGENIENLENYRVQSLVFDLNFPKNNVYDVTPGITRSVCEGYWVFLKPLTPGKHNLHFKGENLLTQPYTTAQLNATDIFRPIRKYVLEKSMFKLDVTYEITIS